MGSREIISISSLDAEPVIVYVMSNRFAMARSPGGVWRSVSRTSFIFSKEAMAMCSNKSTVAIGFQLLQTCGSTILVLRTSLAKDDRLRNSYWIEGKADSDDAGETAPGMQEADLKMRIVSSVGKWRMVRGVVSGRGLGRLEFMICVHLLSELLNEYSVEYWSSLAFTSLVKAG